MKRLIIIIAAVLLLATPVSAMDITAPPVPDSGEAFLKGETESFSEGVWSIVKEAVSLIQPSLADAAGISLGIIAIVVLVSVVKMLPGSSEQTVELIGTLAVAVALTRPTGALIQRGAETVTELSEYGKLLIPVLTTALAAQGGVNSSTALYGGTIAFDAILSTFISSVIVPAIYIFLCLGTASCAIGEAMLDKLKAFAKWLITWGLKIVLYIFTGFLGITGVVSGSVDAAALKATKLTISGVVPVVGGILSEASEAVLVSAGIMKSTAGIYGLLALIAVWIGPFIEIGIQYLLLKATAALCSAFAAKKATALVADFSSAMGILLAMTGSVCLMLMVSVVCFMRGVG